MLFSDAKDFSLPHKGDANDDRMKRRALSRIIGNNMNSKAKVVLKGVVGISAGAAIGLAVSLLSRYAGSG